jgi:hypothetical protein
VLALLAASDHVPDPVADPVWASPLPPFLRAHRFLEGVSHLTAAEWHAVLQRATDTDPVVRRAARRALTDLLVGHPQAPAFGALTRAAYDVAEAVGHRRLVPADTVFRLSMLTAEAANAVALRERLTSAHGRALYDLFVRSDGPPAPELPRVRSEPRGNCAPR